MNSDMGTDGGRNGSDFSFAVSHEYDLGQVISLTRCGL